MSIYSTTDHRKIYETFIGPIPKDEDGRSYEIHHIDGNHNNNEISNLLCVSIKEHYEIHKSQGDYKACLIMSQRMKVSPEEKSYLAKLSNTGENNPMYGTIWINNGIINKKIRGDVPEGWARGRLISNEYASKFTKRSRAGTNNTRFNKTIYCFENIETLEQIHSTSYEFAIKYGVSTKGIRGIILKNKTSYKGWRIVSD
jgi:hypothetical protein